MMDKLSRLFITDSMLNKVHELTLEGFSVECIRSKLDEHYSTAVGKIYKTKESGDVEVIGINGTSITIKFLVSGNERIVIRGRFFNDLENMGDTLSRYMLEFPLGSTHQPSTKEYGRYRIIGYSANKVDIEFLNTGFKDSLEPTKLRTGYVRDPYAPVLHGIGYIGVGEHKSTHKNCDNGAYSCWNSMLERCYNKRAKAYKDYGEKGVTVCPEWHCFQNFADYYKKNYMEGYFLDKDLICVGNNEYRPDLCSFVPRVVNNCIKINRSSDEYGRYITYLNDVEKYRACVSFTLPDGRKGKVRTRNFLKYEDAKDWAFATKQESLRNIANVYKDTLDERVYHTLTEGSYQLLQFVYKEEENV